jgi:hypothetical protein
LTLQGRLITVEIMALTSSSLSAESLGPEDGLQDYKAVSGPAVVGLLVGFLSVIAFSHRLLILVPLVGVLVNVYALRQLALASPPLIGRKAALTGLACSLICGISALLQFALYQWEMRAQAVAIADEWFTALRENRPDAAYRLTQYPTTKAGRGSPSIEMTMDNERGQMFLKSVRRFTQEPPVAQLLKLGKRAHVRLYQHEDVWADRDLEGARNVYVVTVGDGPHAASFFVRLGCSRSQDVATGDWQWQITKYEFISMPSEEILDSLEG